MLHQIVFLIALGIGSVFSAPQFLTFKDGNIGVNFGGYKAQAGLGGLLTGNTAQGGLGASAGTPWGASAGAGIGGTVKDDTAGVAFAGAKLNDDINAGSVIGGSTGSQQFGFLGAESNANEKPPSTGFDQGSQTPSSDGATITKHVLFTKDQFNSGSVQKIKPPKKYASETNVSVPVDQKATISVPGKNSRFAAISSEESDANTQQNGEKIQKQLEYIKFHQRRRRLHPAARHHLHLHKQILFPLPTEQSSPEQSEANFNQHKKVIKSVHNGTSPPSQTSDASLQASHESGNGQIKKTLKFNHDFIMTAFNIPIGILQSIRDNLPPVSVQKEIKYSKSS